MVYTQTDYEYPFEGEIEFKLTGYPNCTATVWVTGRGWVDEEGEFGYRLDGKAIESVFKTEKMGYKADDFDSQMYEVFQMFIQNSKPTARV